MLVHLGEGFFVNKMCVEYVIPRPSENEIVIYLSGHKRLLVPFHLMEKVIEALEKSVIR